MAQTEFWDQSDARLINLGTLHAQFSETQFGDNINMRFLGASYQDAMFYVYEMQGRYHALGILGEDLVVANDVLTGGTVRATLNMYYNATYGQWYYSGYWSGLSVSAKAYFNPYLTTSVADDRALVRSMLQGNDLRVYHDYNDYGLGYTGGDTLRGGGGSDSLFGNEGSDLLEGGTGNDLLNGGSHFDRIVGGAGSDHAIGDSGDDVINGGDGNDIVEGGIGQDKLYGANGQDLLEGGVGNDTLTGNAGNDSFLFRAHHGLDHITDFQDALDRIGVAVPAGTDMNLKLKYVGGDVVATFLDVTLVIDDVRAGSITAADFFLLP